MEKKEVKKEIREINLFGKNLKRILKEKKLKQKDLARKLGVAEQQISLYTRGDILPSTSRIFMMSKILRVNVGDFFVDDEIAAYITTGRKIETQPLYSELFELVDKLSGEEIQLLIGTAKKFL